MLPRNASSLRQPKSAPTPGVITIGSVCQWTRSSTESRYAPWNCARATITDSVTTAPPATPTAPPTAARATCCAAAGRTRSPAPTTATTSKATSTDFITFRLRVNASASAYAEDVPEGRVKGEE